MLYNEKWTAPYDYKVYCFNGKAEYIMVCAGREKGHPTFYFFDRLWNLARIDRDTKNAPVGFTMPKPDCVDKMLEYAEKMSAPFPFVRVDFFVVDGQLYFGELTFTPDRNLDTDILSETDDIFGKMIDLSQVQHENKKRKQKIENRDTGLNLRYYE